MPCGPLPRLPSSPAPIRVIWPPSDVSLAPTTHIWHPPTHPGPDPCMRHPHLSWYVPPALYMLPTRADLPPTHVSWPLPTASRPPALTDASRPPLTRPGPHGRAMAPMDAYQRPTHGPHTSHAIPSDVHPRPQLTSFVFNTFEAVVTIQPRPTLQHYLYPLCHLCPSRRLCPSCSIRPRHLS